MLDVDPTSSDDSRTENTSTKKTGGMFKKSPKPVERRTHSPGDLSSSSELSGTTDSLTDTGGLFSGMFKKSPKLFARTQFQADLSENSELTGSSEKLTEKSSKGRVTKMLKNPFTSPAQKDTEDPESLKDNEREREKEKPKEVKRNMTQSERRDRAETMIVPPRPTEEEMKRTTTTCDKVTLTGAGNKQQKQSADETLDEDKSSEGRDAHETKAAKVKRPGHNPFMPRTGDKLASVDTAKEGEETENVETSTQEKKKEEESSVKAEAKVNKPKRHTPFMPRVKGKVIQKRTQNGAEGNTGENESGGRCLFDRLEDFRIEPSQPESSQDVDNLMEWWNTVENWEDAPQFEDMTPKEEAKAFAVTADKVQKGIRVFNKLFSERAESLWQHVIDLNSIADGLDKFNKNTKIAQITGGSTSAIGGVATIAGLALAPVTMGTSLIVTAVGLGVATAGGLTSAGAGISNQVNNSMDRKKVEKIVEDYQEKMLDLNKALKFIKQGIEDLRRFDLIKMKNHAYNRDFPVLNSNFYEDGAMAGKAILINANEIMRVVQIANAAGSTAARAVQIASMATGVLTGLFVGMDIYFVTKDSKELKKGAKSEFAAKIREVVQQLHDGLVELNSIRDELQATTAPDNNQRQEDSQRKNNEDQYKDEEDEDEIDRIKKAIKEDYENRV